MNIHSITGYIYLQDACYDGWEGVAVMTIDGDENVKWMGKEMGGR